MSSMHETAVKLGPDNSLQRVMQLLFRCVFNTGHIIFLSFTTCSRWTRRFKVWFIGESMVVL